MKRKNTDSPYLGGEWPQVPPQEVDEQYPSGCRGPVLLIALICACVLVIATAMAVMASRGGP